MSLIDFHHAMLACATCVGDPNDPASVGANSAILAMLGVLVIVLGSIGGFIFHLARRPHLAGRHDL